MPTASILKDVIMTPFSEPTLCGNAYTSTQTERKRDGGHGLGGGGAGGWIHPRNDGKMCPSSQLRTIILCKKIVSIAFEAGSKAALMGVMAGNGGDSGRRSDIFGWRNCWLRACKGLNYTEG